MGSSPAWPGVVKSLADELGPAGIRMNGILPVRIATGRVRELDARRGDPDQVRARLSEQIPLRRYGEPEEFGRAAAFLLSPAASYITGAMIPVDGGHQLDLSTQPGEDVVAGPCVPPPLAQPSAGPVACDQQRPVRGQARQRGRTAILVSSASDRLVRWHHA
jgi:Enoyl-(Acyl carrier protein) reductase